MTLRRSTGHVQRHYGTNLAAADKLGVGKNALLNGCFRVAQRGTSFDAGTTYPNDDGGYTLDRWLLLSDGDDIADISQDTTNVPDGAYASIKFEIETANKKCGILQLIEARDVAWLWNNQSGVVSLSFKAQTQTSDVGNLRAAVLAWDDAADTVTSDVVDTWEAEGTNPGLVANWTYENTATDLALTDSWRTFEIPNIALDTASTTNIGVFIWADDGDMAVDDVFWVADVQLERGAICTPFERRLLSCELVSCQRFYQKTFDQATAPAQNAGRNGAISGVAVDGDSGGVIGQWDFAVPMRAVPTITYFNPSAADTKWDNVDGVDPTSSTYDVGDARLLCTDGNGAHNINDRCYLHAIADAEL